MHYLQYSQVRDTFAIAMVQMTMNFVTIIKTINIR